MADKSLTDFLGSWSGQVKTLIENSSQSSEPDYMSKSDFDTAISAFNASQWFPSFRSSYLNFPSYAPYNLYKLADNYVISLLPVDSDKYDYTGASKKIQLAEMAYKLTNGQLTESINKIEPTLTYTKITQSNFSGIDNDAADYGYDEFQISYDGDGMLACQLLDDEAEDNAGWAYIDKDNIMSVAVKEWVTGNVYIKAYEGHTYKTKVITIPYDTYDESAW